MWTKGKCVLEQSNAGRLMQTYFWYIYTYILIWPLWAKKYNVTVLFSKQSIMVSKWLFSLLFAGGCRAELPANQFNRPVVMLGNTTDIVFSVTQGGLCLPDGKQEGFSFVFSILTLLEWLLGSFRVFPGSSHCFSNTAPMGWGWA